MRRTFGGAMYSEEVVGVLNIINKTLMEIGEEIRSLSARARF
jgi:hypothetical protein